MHNQEIYFPGTVPDFLANTHVSNGYLVTNEALGCDSCTNPAFLDGRRDLHNVPAYASIIPRNDGVTTDIVYWMFYPYNAGKRVCIGYYANWWPINGCVGGYSTFGNHVGDWEHIVIRFVHGYLRETYYS